MLKHERILLLGPTGVEKRAAFERLSHDLKHRFQVDSDFIDFENDILKDYLPGSKSWTNFLWQYPADQHRVWADAWKALPKFTKGKATVLALHGAFISTLVGLRCPIDVRLICEKYKPTLVVTLIDDVYSTWHRTEERANGREDKGRPTFEQHLLVRRAEQFVGDLIVTHSQSPNVRHILCATGNATAALSNIISHDAAVTYLSFPISQPRKLADKGEPEMVQIINRAHRLALQEMRKAPQRAFITPLSIDEKPVEKPAERAAGESFDFDVPALRWSMKDAWGEPDATLVDTFNQIVKIDGKQLKSALPLIVTDVGWRDRRLVLQSKSLAIVSPRPPGRESITNGVHDEVNLAITQGIFCHWWQPEKWDVDHAVNRLWPAVGAMGIGQAATWTMQAKSIEQLIEAPP